MLLTASGVSKHSTMTVVNLNLEGIRGQEDLTSSYMQSG